MYKLCSGGIVQTLKCVPCTQLIFVETRHCRWFPKQCQKWSLKTEPGLILEHTNLCSDQTSLLLSYTHYFLPSKRLKANLLESLQLWVRHHRRSKLKLPNFVMCLSRSQTGAWWGECKVWGNDGVWKQWELTLVELQIKYYMPKSQLSIPLKNLLL